MYGSIENIKELFNKCENSNYDDEIYNYFIEINHPKFSQHREFFLGWINTNIEYFDSFNDIKLLIDFTSQYVNNNLNNKVANVFKPQTTIEHKTIGELSSRSVNHAKKIKSDLETLSIHGSKTKELIQILDNFINQPNLFIPTKLNFKHNVEDIRKHLYTLKIDKDSIQEYINYFQKI